MSQIYLPETGFYVQRHSVCFHCCCCVCFCFPFPIFLTFLFNCGAGVFVLSKSFVIYSLSLQLSIIYCSPPPIWFGMIPCTAYNQGQLHLQSSTMAFTSLPPKPYSRRTVFPSLPQELHSRMTASIIQ